jgi:hypothetical protein
MEASLADRQPFHGELAVVVDECSFAYHTAMHPLTGSLVLQSIIQLPRVGVAWDFHLLTKTSFPEWPHRGTKTHESSDRLARTRTFRLFVSLRVFRGYSPPSAQFVFSL